MIMLQCVDRGHQMLESEVYYEERNGDDDCREHDQQRRTLQLAPCRPGHLLGELHIGLFAIVNELSHLYL